MSDCGTLRVTVSDEGGTPLPCRLHIKLADGTCYLPPEDATAEYSETTAPDLLLPGHYRRYLHICHGTDLHPST